MTKQMYTIGYRRRSVEELSRMADRLGAILLDIRHSPWSRRPEFRKKYLAEVLRQRCQHVPELGNVNYGSGSDIKIANLEAGQEIIEASERPVILTSACFDSCICRRALSSSHLRAESFSVEELMDVEEVG